MKLESTGWKKKRINADHPNCVEYTARLRALWDAYFKREEVEKAKYPDWRGLDHPADVVLRPIFRTCCEDVKLLQQEYAYLFTEEEPDDAD